tara:strand:+ start:379 stop:594 length:216 start_codon:yes stop_codon:yes gene_type:complete
MNKISVGQLVYVPSNTMLKKIKNGAVSDYLITDVPTNVLVLEDLQHDKLGIHFNGEKWYVTKKDVYNAKIN